METLSSLSSDQGAPSAPYTVVDVKFEAGTGVDDSGSQDSQDLLSHLVQQEEREVCDENTNKRKRTAPKKLSVDEEDDDSEEELDMSSVVKVEYTNSEGGLDDIAAEEGIDDNDHDDNIAAIRANNQQLNCKQRDDCPVCGDKANGLHYGIYSCEGCKNFFKRSVVIVQNKPYVCQNQNRCDVRIVYDKSGIKRKGARCQSCRYTACLDAGMSHPGFPRTRGGRHGGYIIKAAEKNEPAYKLPKLESSMSLKDTDENSSTMNFDDSSWDNSANEISSNTWDTLNDQLSLTANNLFESIQQDDLERERSINRELQTRLTERDAQLKISERQNEKMKRQVMTTNTLVKIQQEQIKMLRTELTKMKNVQNGEVNHHGHSLSFKGGTSQS